MASGKDEDFFIGREVLVFFTPRLFLLLTSYSPVGQCKISLVCILAQFPKAHLRITRNLTKPRKTLMKWWWSRSEEHTSELQSQR